MRNLRWMTENGVSAPGLGTRDGRFYFWKKRGCQELFEFVVGPPARPGEEPGGWVVVADVLKVMALSRGFRLLCASTCCRLLKLSPLQ